MPGTSPWPQRLVGMLAVLLAVGVVALAAVGGSLYWQRVESRAAQDTRAELAPLAAETIPKILGYDYQTVETTMTDVYPLLTPGYRQEFETQATQTVIPQARQRQIVSQVNVVGRGVMSAARNTGTVLVYLNRTVTDKSKEPLVDGARVQVSYQKVDGRWLIDMIKPI